MQLCRAVRVLVATAQQGRAKTTHSRVKTTSPIISTTSTQKNYLSEGGKENRTKMAKRLVRVYFDRKTDYRTVAIQPSTTAVGLRDRISQRYGLPADQTEGFVIVLLTRRRPQWRQDTSTLTTTSLSENRTASSSISSEDGRTAAARARSNRLRKNWDGARVLQKDEVLMDLIQEDRRLRWPDKPEQVAVVNQGFDNVESLQIMFMFKNSRFPLDVGCEFCGSSGDDEDDYEEESSLPRQSMRDQNDDDNENNENNNDEDDRVLHLHQLEARGPCTGSGPSERFVLGLPLDPQSRVPYQSRRPSNWKPLVNNWSPEDLLDVTTYGIMDFMTAESLSSSSSTSSSSTSTTTNSSNVTASLSAAAATAAAAAVAAAAGTDGGGCSGYLLRRSQHDELVWYRRWCVVSGDTLWCCKSKRNQRHMIKIPLGSLQFNGSEYDDVIISPASQTNHSMRYCFEVKAAGRDYMFRARDSRERNRWLKVLEQHIHVANQNEQMKLAELIISEQEYRSSQLDEARLERVTSSLSCLLEDEEARQLFAHCLRDWRCVEGLYFCWDVEDWRLAAEQLAADIQEKKDTSTTNAGDGSESSRNDAVAAATSSAASSAASSASSTAPSSAFSTAPDASSVDGSPAQPTKSSSSGGETTSYRIGSGRFDASVNMLWEQREYRREQQLFIARSLELWDRAKDIYDKFMNSATAQYEVLLERCEKDKVKQLLISYFETEKNQDDQDFKNIGEQSEKEEKVSEVGGETEDENSSSSSSSSLLRPTPPPSLFVKAQESVMEDMKKGVYPRFMASDEGKRGLARICFA